MLLVKERFSLNEVAAIVDIRCLNGPDPLVHCWPNLKPETILALMPLEVGVEGLMKRKQGGHVTKDKMFLRRTEDVQMDQGVSIGLPDQLQILHKIFFSVVDFKDSLLKFYFLL